METLLSAFGTLTTRSPEDEAQTLRENLALVTFAIDNFSSIDVQVIIARLERWNEIYRTQITWDMEMYPEHMHESITKIIGYFKAINSSSNLQYIVETRNLYNEILNNI